MIKWMLHVDTARNSGWCLTNHLGHYIDSGECNAFGEEPAKICRRVLAEDASAVLMLEKPSHGNRSQLVGMGAARGAWMAAWLQALGKESRVKDVFPATWRSQVFGDTAKNATRERLSAQVFSHKHECGPDESAAVCIALWATRKAKIEALAPKAPRGKRSGKGRAKHHTGPAVHQHGQAGRARRGQAVRDAGVPAERLHAEVRDARGSSPGSRDDRVVDVDGGSADGDRATDPAVRGATG